MSEKIITLYQKYKKEYEKTGRYKHIVVRYTRELKRLGINVNEIAIPKEIEEFTIPKKINCSKFIDFNNFFDKIYVINLNHETERKEIFLKRNQHVPFSFSFFEGVYGKEDKKCQDIFKSYLKKPIG